MGWVAAGDGYELGMADGKMVCRRAGKVLKSVPKAVKESPAAVALRQLQEWLGRHDERCLREVEDCPSCCRRRSAVPAG
jgi:hypothetical protein